MTIHPDDLPPRFRAPGTEAVSAVQVDAPASLRDVTPGQWRAFAAVFLGWIVDSFDFNILAFIVIDIQNSFRIDNALAGLLGTVTLVMRLVGGTIAGTIADKYGRKLPLMLSIIWFRLSPCRVDKAHSQAARILSISRCIRLKVAVTSSPASPRTCSGPSPTRPTRTRH